MNQPLTFFTCSIYPDVTRIWFHCVRKVLGDEARIVIYDSSGLLQQGFFPGAMLVPIKNVQHGTKIDHFIRSHLKTDLFFLMDDDAFLLARSPVDYALDWLNKDQRHAIVSFKPRLWWSIKIDEREFPTMGSYALAVNATIIREHKLSFESKRTDRKDIRNGTGYYDTADYLNEYLLKDGYAIEIAPSELREKVPTFFGTSSAMMAFYNSRWFSKRRRRKSREEIEKVICEDPISLQRAISVAYVSRIYRQLFREPLVYDDFIGVGEIDSIVAKAGKLNFDKLLVNAKQDFDEIERSILSI